VSRDRFLETAMLEMLKAWAASPPSSRSALSAEEIATAAHRAYDESSRLDELRPDTTGSQYAPCTKFLDWLDRQPTKTRSTVLALFGERYRLNGERRGLE
jgi:hypothetical protein